MTPFFSRSPWHRQGVLSMLITAVATFALSACGGGSGGNTDGGATQSTSTTITGLVQDTSAKAIQGAVVQTDGQTVTTGADGRFSFTVASTTPTTVVLVKKSGFASNAKSAPVASGRTTDITVNLAADQVVSTFNSTSGTTLTPNGATVLIPADAIQTATGAAYTGTVNVGASYSGPDTVAGVQAFPAPYEGIDAGTSSPLITMGVIEVKLTDSVGNALQLKTGSSATLTYPANSVSAAGAATVPLWFYDETSKIWTRDGQATRQTDGSYKGTVTHFTLWNADFKGVTATLKGCFHDATDKAVTRAGTVGLRGNGWSHLFNGVSSDGNFTVLRVPSGMPLELYSATQTPAFTTVAIPALVAGEERTLACAVVSTPPTGTVITVPEISTLFVTTPASFAGKYTGTYSGAETGTFAVVINSSGQVSGTVTSITYTGLVASVSGAISGTGTVSLTATGTAGASTFSGTSSATGALSGTWQYTGNNIGSGTFVGQRN
jgi:hypothetical protein